MNVISELAFDNVHVWSFQVNCGVKLRHITGTAGTAGSLSWHRPRLSLWRCVGGSEASGRCRWQQRCNDPRPAPHCHCCHCCRRLGPLPFALSPLQCQSVPPVAIGNCRQGTSTTGDRASEVLLLMLLFTTLAVPPLAVSVVVQPPTTGSGLSITAWVLHSMQCYTVSLRAKTAPRRRRRSYCSLVATGNHWQPWSLHSAPAGPLILYSRLSTAGCQWNIGSNYKIVTSTTSRDTIVTSIQEIANEVRKSESLEESSGGRQLPVLTFCHH